MSLLSNICSLFGAKNKNPNAIPNDGDLDELHELAKKYLYGDGLIQNYSLAIMYLEFAAQKGHAESLRTLGVCYSEGIGVQQSFEKAFELYQKAAELGLVDACFDLGVCYRRGEGVEMNLEKPRNVIRKLSMQEIMMPWWTWVWYIVLKKTWIRLNNTIRWRLKPEILMANSAMECSFTIEKNTRKR